VARKKQSEGDIFPTRTPQREADPEKKTAYRNAEGGFYKGDVKRKHFSHPQGGDDFLTSSPESQSPRCMERWF
jgi:hypothetical protein